MEEGFKPTRSSLTNLQIVNTLTHYSRRKGLSPFGPSGHSRCELLQSTLFKVVNILTYYSWRKGLLPFSLGGHSHCELLQ
ncbi:hypothetical protein K2173_019820 [Erythroxylum novogranatense]|uniref:Uncharacterized protein n=1 Tax=Erythroxylum novogranatense TaxID=1862640 RepID=A0AAV8SN44_9ROSI|nr:hypothetical protein K2173_019820 [Erythroxylum novogranatense]